MQRLGENVGASEHFGSEGVAQLACVYTALVGGYEALNEQPVAANSRLAFICLTDDPDLRSETWQIRRVEPLFRLDPIRSQRALKLLPHEHLPDYECSIYVDNSVLLKTPPDALIEQYLGTSAFCLPQHSYRNSVLEEFLEVEALGYDDQARLFEQLNHYALEFPDMLEERPFWTGVLLRDHRNPKVRRMLDIWLAHVQRYSRRDQLSINLAFRLAGLKPEVLRIDNYESWFHCWPKRANSRRVEFNRLSSPFLSNPFARAKELATNLERMERALCKREMGSCKREAKKGSHTVVDQLAHDRAASQAGRLDTQLRPLSDKKARLRIAQVSLTCISSVLCPALPICTFGLLQP